MAATEYIHPLTDFLNDKVSIPRLTQEIDDSEIVIKLSDDGISVVGTDCHIWFMAALDGDDRGRLDTIVANHSGEPLPSDNLPVALQNVALDQDKQLRTSNYPREVGNTRIIYSPNFADKCTWWQGSTQVIGQELTDSGDHLTYNSPHAHWIDLIHGRLSHEDEVGVVPNKSTYLATVYIDGTPATERPPFQTSGGDYAIDYTTGDVTFFTSQEGKTVTADYSYAVSSTYVFGPDAGKILKIEKSEIQYSDDVQMNATFYYAPFAYNPADLPNKIQAAPAHVYKGLKDFVVEANGVYPIHPAVPNTNGRGLARPHINAPFDYGTVRTLYSSMGVEIRIWLDPNEACGGEFAEMTFYCMEFDEPQS